MNRKCISTLILAVCLAVHCLTAQAADLCLEGLCVVRAQATSTNGLMTRYHPLLLTFENRTGQAKSIAGFTTAAADSVNVMRGDDWDAEHATKVRLKPNEYVSLDARSELRVMMVGLKQELHIGDVIYVVITVGKRQSLTIPVTVI
jgi:copper(I)-binding protein